MFDGAGIGSRSAATPLSRPAFHWGFACAGPAPLVDPTDDDLAGRLAELTDATFSPGADIVSAVRRLLDLGAEPVSLASALTLGVGQRVVRTNCKHCSATGASPLTARIPEDRLSADDRRTVALRAIQEVKVLLVDGEPGSSQVPGLESMECFPPALLYIMGPDGNLTSTRSEPIAADVRPNKDGRNDARLKLLAGNIGRAVIKVSAVPEDRHVIEAPARVFTTQDELHAAFKAGELDRDVIVVVRFQGPQANGMPELHKLTPPLAVLQNKGYRVALVTDGRMSGASGKVPAAIHLSPEALAGGPIAKVRDGDVIRLDALAGTLATRGHPSPRKRSVAFPQIPLPPRGIASE